jgi:hypothetical protein
MSDAITAFDLASVDHVLSTTRSVRLRLDFDRDVSRSIIDEALESHFKHQPAQTPRPGGLWS